jgi:tRNA(fMet)-specific endonuclease VapC
MNRYLLDSNHASPLVTLHHPLRRRVLQAIDSGDAFFIAIPVLTETVFGLSTLPRWLQNLSEWTRLRETIDCFIPDEGDAQHAAELQLVLRKRGRRLETVDALIAAVALHHDLVLLTADRDFDAIPGLQLENWLAPFNTR